MKLSEYLNWTFVSCHGPMKVIQRAIFPSGIFDTKGLRKPDVRAYDTVVEKLGCSPSNILLIDDREQNIRVGKQIGFDVIHFQNAALLRSELQNRGWNV